MKSFFSRFNDSQTGSSKPAKESSYKFWVPSNNNAERDPHKPIPVHPDVAASHGEKRSRALKSTHAFKLPLVHDVPTASIETQAIHTNDMSRHTTRPNLATSSKSYSQNNPPPSSRTPRPHEYSDTKYQVPLREVHGHPTGTHTFREASNRNYRSGKHESVAPIHREIWLPSPTPTFSKQIQDQTKLQVQGMSEKLGRYRENGDVRDRVKELEHREKDRERDRKESDREKEKEWEKGRAKEREREREKTRAKGQERGHEKEREIPRAKREQDRNWEIDRGRDRDKYADRDLREKERDSDREGKSRTSRKGSSNLTRGMERAWDSDVPHDGERLKQDEHSKARHRDRTTGFGGRDDNRETHKERLEKEPERTRERLGGQIKHRAEVTDSELVAGRIRTSAPDREKRKDSGIGWASDTYTGHGRKLLRKMSSTQLNPSPKVEEGEISDSPKHVQQVLTKRHRIEEGRSSSKIIHSRQGVPAEPLIPTKSQAVKATIVAFSEDVQLPVPPTPQHMPIYLPPKEFNAVDSGLPPNIAPLNAVSASFAETPPRRETVNRLKSSRLDEPLPHAAENVSKSKEVDTSITHRPPSRGPAQPQNPIPLHPTIGHLLKGTHESAYIHKPRQTQPSLGSSPLPEAPRTPIQAEASKEFNHPLERSLKKEAEVDLIPSGPGAPSFPEQKTPVPTQVPLTSIPIATEGVGQNLKVFTPFRYLTTKRNRAVSLVSVEAQDGTAPSTVVGSPTASMHSQAPFQPPPIRDPMQATKEWRNKDEAGTYPNGKLRRQRPGVVFDVAEEPLGGDPQRPKRTHTRHTKTPSKPPS